MSVARKDQDASDDMVSEHLMMIFPAFFDVDREDLMKPKGKLNKIVPLQKAINRPVGPACPHLP